MAEVRNILIVGGGIAGLTLAVALERQGFSAELVERSPDWRAVGAGLLVQANGMRVLRGLELDGAVLEVINELSILNQTRVIESGWTPASSAPSLRRG
jgi:2-polyprenyl-6-methoxyphenol hydroxylase-like FAD-dependent oxidoreductase